MADFLATCKAVYSCPEQPIRLPFDEISGDQKYSGYSFAPFVSLTLKFSNQEITVTTEYLTVGNNSRPFGNNTAVIKAMEFGASEGMGCTIEIFDEEGGNFTKSFEFLNKGLAGIEDQIKNFELDFGWIVEKKCGDGSDIKKYSVSSREESRPINLLLSKMNVVYEGGKIKYILEAQDNTQRISEVRHECNIGTEDKKVSLKDAIKIFMKTQLPRPFLDVKFLKKDGTEWNFANSDGGPNGPKSVWGSCQQNKLATLRRWISQLTTADGKGIILRWQGKDKGENPREGATIVLLEDPAPEADSSGIIEGCGDMNIATFIVNGGSKSPVLSFNPSVNWILAGLGKSGGGSSPNSGKASKQDGEKDDKRDISGIMTGSTIDSSTINWRYVGDQAEKNANANTAHQEANQSQEMFEAIQAELKIIGDPSFVFPIDFLGRYLSLIVINPFHLRNNGENGCPDWLAEPACNPVFSNKNWRISGVNHQIREGSYVTTLKLGLDSPNYNLPPDAPLGGDKDGLKVEIQTNSERKCTE